MGIIGSIAKVKGQFHQTRLKIIQGKTAKLQDANLKEAELTKAKQEYREARQIRADLKADQMKQVEGERPSKLKAFGQGVAHHINKAKAPKPQRMRTTKPSMIGVPQNRLKQPSSTSQGGIFGGQRNLDVGGETGSPFNKKEKPRSIF